MFQRGNIGAGSDLASTLCKYDLRKGDLLVFMKSNFVFNPNLIEIN